MYVTDNNGKRIMCRHPGEMYQVYTVLGNDATDELIRERAGFLSDCFCTKCLAKFGLDLKRDQHICPGCASVDVMAANDAVGEPCPKCGTGTIVAEDSGIIT